MSTLINTKYRTCGQELKQLREARGIATQGDLARLLGFRQQTISRWESGASRPRADQIAILATVLETDPHRLMVVAGHNQERVSASFDQPLPLASLSPEGFERFCRSLLQALYPEAIVHAAGSTGHKQFGIDIAVDFSRTTRHTFQCKRERDFGPVKVKAAIKAHKESAAKKHILLSSVASPLARKEVQKHREWDIWDQDDLSDKWRSLPKQAQREIVDIFFAGQRFALLGDPSPGPWLTTASFFEPLLSKDRAFSHHWALVGRESECKTIAEALSDNAKLVISVVGAAGGGKSRVLRTVVEEFRARTPGTAVYMLSPTDSVTPKSLEDLGSGPKLLVVDDAHDRTDREHLARYVATTAANARLLLVYRPYATDVIERELARYGLVGDITASVPLNKYTRDNAQALAHEVLQNLGGPVSAATQIADVAYDSPLSVVVGAWIVAKEGINPQLFGKSDVFKATVLQRYKEVVAEGIASSARDTDLLERILRVVALIQPMAPNEERVLTLLQDVEAISAPDATRLTKLLVTSGVLFKRGTRYRLSPDLLADSIIETAYITIDGRSNGAAERIFDAAIGDHKTNILVNLGRLDWRRNEGDTSESSLLDRLWSRLTWEEDYARAQLKAAREAAFYQPRHAIQFAERLVGQGHGGDEDVCGLIRNAAYTLRYLSRACELLWEIGRTDGRQRNQYPHHAIRILEELAEPEPRKPIAYCEGVVDFALSLLPQADSWTGACTPFDVLKGALSTEGHYTSSSTSRAITLSAFQVNADAVGPMRGKIIDAVLESVLSPDKRRAFVAAAFVATTVHGPVGRLTRNATEGELSGWEKEFSETLSRINMLLDSSEVPPVILVRIAVSVSWHAHYPEGITKRPAQKILDRLDRDLPTRVTRSLMDGWGHETWKHDLDRLDRTEQIQMALAKELAATYPKVEARKNFVGERLSDIISYCGGLLGSEHFLVGRLIESDPSFALSILSDKVAARETPLTRFTPIALASLLNSSPIDAAQQIESLLGNAESDLSILSHAYAMTSDAWTMTEIDKNAIRKAFSSADPAVLQWVSGMFRGIVKRDATFAVELLSAGNANLISGTRGDIFMWLDDDKSIPLQSLSDDQLGRLLKLFEGADELDDHFVYRFVMRVAKRAPKLVVDLARRRMERSIQENKWQIRPIAAPYRNNESLGVLDHPDGLKLLKDVLDWAVPRIDDYSFAHRFADLVSSVFGVDHPSIPSILESWSVGNDVAHFKVISCVLREADSSFVFQEFDFVQRILRASKMQGIGAYKDLRSSLYAAAVSGVRTGSPGQPFPRDVEMKQKAEAALKTIGKTDPAYALYENIRDHAKDDIARALAQGAAMDEEDKARLEEQD